MGTAAGRAGGGGRGSLSGFLLFHGLNQPPARAAAAATPHAALRMKPARSDWASESRGVGPRLPAAFQVLSRAPPTHPPSPRVPPRSCPELSDWVAGTSPPPKPSPFVLSPPPHPSLLFLLAHERHRDCSSYTSLFVTYEVGGEGGRAEGAAAGAVAGDGVGGCAGAHSGSGRLGVFLWRRRACPPESVLSANWGGSLGAAVDLAGGRRGPRLRRRAPSCRARASGESRAGRGGVLPWGRGGGLPSRVALGLPC